MNWRNINKTDLTERNDENIILPALTGVERQTGKPVRAKMETEFGKNRQKTILSF